MEPTDRQFETISSYLPIKRGNLKLSDHEVPNEILYVAEQGCKWRALPEPSLRELAYGLYPYEQMVQGRNHRIDRFGMRSGTVLE